MAILSGYSVQKASREATAMPGLRRTLILTYKGLSIKGEKYRIANIAGKKIELQESDFHQKGVLAVSLEKQALEPMEELDVYIVKRSSRG